MFPAAPVIDVDVVVVVMDAVNGGAECQEALRAAQQTQPTPASGPAFDVS
jgi:hypothetical protein